MAKDRRTWFQKQGRPKRRRNDIHNRPPRKWRTLTERINLWIVLVIVIMIVAIVISIYFERINEAEPKQTDLANRRLRLATKFSSSSHAEGRSKAKDLDVLVIYSDTSGTVRSRTVKSSDLSSSWVWKAPSDGNDDQTNSTELLEDPLQPVLRSEDCNVHLTNEHSAGGEMPHSDMSPMDQGKLKRQMLHQERRDRRVAELIQVDKETDCQMQADAIERSKEFDTNVKGKYSMWRKGYENLNSDSTLKLMRNQIIKAKVYASIARGKNETDRATLDAELNPSALDRAKEMGHTLSFAKDRLYDCITVARKLRAMLQSMEANVNALKKKSTFLIQLAAKTVPKELHCLPILLTTEYYLKGYQNTGFPFSPKLEDPSFYHYAIFSDNVLATSVVVNSTVLHTNEPRKHIFHIVMDKLNFAAMKMWFLVNPPAGATIQVENVDDFTWLNSSYCPVLCQLESARMKEYYFKADQASSLTAITDNLNYRNPKDLSMLNHLRFYLPEVYPKLDKILFLDDDIVVQKDLTPLWFVDLQGMVNGAVETLKESFHRFDEYLNFSDPKISETFDPNACGWAFGMNIFDLKEWKLRDITGIYHHWQNLNEDRTLWKLGTLPPGLITFYNLMYPLDRSWHVFGLGYNMNLNQTGIENAAVIHYNGNHKPWLDIAITKYKCY